MLLNIIKTTIPSLTAFPGKWRRIITLLLLSIFCLCQSWGETINVNFIILALDGTRALTISNQSAEIDQFIYSQMPDEYKSPFLDNGDIHLPGDYKGDYAFYKNEAAAKERTDAYITQVTADLEGMNIFVVYQYDVSKAKAKGFLSGGSYTLNTSNNKVNNNEWLCYQGTWDTNSKPVTIGSEKYETNTWRSNLLYNKTTYAAASEEDKSKYRYTLNIEDPYQVTILGNVNVMVSGVHQDREDWYLCGGTNPGDIRLQPTLEGAKTYHIWCYAILHGYTTTGVQDPDTYRIIVTDNYNFNNAKNYSNWKTNFTNPNTPDGHYYLNNRGASTKTCFQLRNGGNADIREGANHAITLLESTRFSFVVKTHVSGKKLIGYQIKDYDDNTTTITLPDHLKRKYCNYELYLDSTFTTRVGEGAPYYKTYQNAYEGDATHTGGHTVFYVKYTVSGVPFQFSTENHPKWYSLQASGATIKYNTNNSFVEGTPPTDGGMAANNSFWFAFIGDPYEVKVINRNAGTNKYIGVAANSNTGTNLKSLNSATDQTTWEIVDMGTPNKKFYLRCYGMAKTPAYITYTSGKALSFNVTAAPLELVEIPGYDYLYQVVNNSNAVALEYTAKNMLPGEHPLDAMPDHLKSPAATNYRFYKTLSEAITDNKTTGIINVLSESTAGEGHEGVIYVRYDVDDRMITKPYDVKVNGKYIYVNGSDALEMADDASAQPLARRSWVFEGNDPYKITLRAMSTTDKYLTDSDPVNYTGTLGTTNYAFLYGNGDEDNYALALADGSANSAIKYMGRETDSALKLFYGDPINKDAANNSKIQVTLQDVQAMCSYTIIDHEGNEAIRLYEKVEVFPMDVPDKIKSPLAKNWRFYTNADDAIKDAKENSRIGKVSSFTYDQFLSGILDVWVRYDTDDSNVKLNAQDGTTEAPFYTLEFTDDSSPKIYMESSNIPTDNYERPDWAYVNGFGQFYLYGNKLHEEIFSQGKSNRTRFLWYFQGNDPYNVEIMSYQMRSSKNMYFRTYYDNGLEKVVTVLTQKDYGLLHPESNDVIHNDSVPSKYMILGQQDAYQFTTRNYFNGAQHTVEQLEHGWRYAGESAGTDEIDELFAKKNIKVHHLDFDNKHWFVTVQMGKTIKIFEEELVPVLVLIDRHGWRLKYWPFSRRNDDAIKLFSSPMVTKYKWYYDGQVALTGEDGGTNTISKTTGYYHYVIPEGATPNFESPELSWTYWNNHKSGSYSSVNINIYVTYEVEGAEGWTGTDTGVSGPDCLLDQNGMLGYTSADGKLMNDQSTGEYLRSYYFYSDSLYLNDNSISAEKLWLLKRNPDIDKEMGYTESDPLTYTTEQQLIDPYNLRIMNKSTNTYLTTTYIEETGDLLSSIEMTDSPDAVRATRREDDNNRQITGATWMYVQDLQGHPRLVPRFDKDYSLTRLSRMQETESMNHPEQWTRITPIKQYNLHIREKGSTEDVLTATITARAFAGQPIMLKDEHKRHWCEYNEFHSKEVEGLYSDTIKTFPYMSDNLYAVFDYANDSPRFSKTADDAWWYNMGIGGTPKYADGTGPTDVTATATSTTNDTKWLWGFVGTPYKFQVINYAKNYLKNDGKLSTATEAAYWTTPVGLKDGETEVPYFKREDSDTYLVISSNKLAVNNTTPTVANNKVTLVSKNEATFKIINNVGKLALAFTAELPAEGLALPMFARSPLVNTADEHYRNGYNFYKAEKVTVSGDSYTIAGDATTLQLNYRPVFGEVIYVRYAYDNSVSTIDLSGKGLFNFQNKIQDKDKTKEYYMYQGTYNRDKTGEWANTLTESSPELGNNVYLWRLWGEDPYNIHITNNNTGENLWIAPSSSDKLNTTDGYTNMRLYDPTTTTAFNTFILVNGSEGEEYEGCYRFMAAYPHKKGTEDANRGSENGIFWYLGRRYDSTPGAFLETGKNTEAKRNSHSNITLIPKNFIMVTYHLTRKVSGEEMTSEKTKAVCKARISLPDGWDRQYCTYTYKTHYDATLQTYDSNNPLKEVTLYPFLTSDGDSYPEIDIYVDYTVGTLPFNLIPTEHNTKAEIEALTADIFKFDTYEERLGKGFGTGKTESDPKGYLYFLVMNTNNAFASGKQYFLQRDQATGRINYMNNDYELHKDNAKNVNNWSYSRVAEYYRASKLAPFRDESWLWAFAGDPYDLYIFNAEGVVQKEYDIMEDKTTITYHPRHALGYKTLSKKTKDKNGVEQTSYEYVPITTDYKESDAAFAGYRWGLGLPKGNNSNATFSLLVNEMDKDQAGVFVPDGTTTPRYWRYTKSSIDNKDEVVLVTRDEKFKGLDYNMLVLPYEPTRYEDVNLEIRRLDNIFIDMSDVETGTSRHTKDDLVPQTSGISELYYAASSRQFAEGDVIKGSVENLPIEAVRHFCDYTLYEDVYDVKGDYTVKAGPYRIEGTDGTYTYKDKDGNIVDASTWPQNLYVSYKVTSDVFLATHPTKDQVAQMTHDNDHVFFMDFTQNLGEESYKKGRHAYFDPNAFFTKDEKTKLETDGSGNAVTTTVKDNDGNDVTTVMQVTDASDSGKNRKQFNTTANRMESVPENLKWYFVGDPYAVQVYCTAGDWGDPTDGKTAANLCRFDPTESRFQYIVDCVHLRVPNTSLTDPRDYLIYYEDVSETLTQMGTVKNPNKDKPFYDNFYWEVVPSIKGSTGAGKDYFALRFKRDNVQLKYKDVYYYLAGADKSKTYVEGTYGVNLSYNSDNSTYTSGTNRGMHTANDADCVIKLVQPAKVYVSAYKPNNQNLNDYTYPEASRVTNQELSEYFGVGEALNEVPRNLQRKFVEYGPLTNTATTISTEDATASRHILGTNFVSMSTCESHTLDAIEDGKLTYYRIDNGGASAPNKVTKRASYKFNVNYRTSDLSNGDGTGTDVHLFTTQAAFNIGRVQWLDFTVGNNNWPYFDKLETTKPALVSNYRTAVDDKTADGWNDGLKGLHWAFIGDPYDFTIVNRRRYEDGTTNESWLAGEKHTIKDYKEYTDSVIWVTKLVTAPTATNTSKATAALADNEINTHWSLQMWKNSTSSKDYFLRTASLKTEIPSASETGETEGLIGDYSNNQTKPGINQTNNYWRVIAKKYDSDAASSYYVAVPFSLSDKSTYSGSKTAANYSKTMQGLGVMDHILDIRTAVAKDEDKADNDCFDAHVRVVSNDGVERIALQENMEIRYDEVTKAMPYILRRHGCNYKCYVDYVDNENRGIEIKNFDSNVYGDSDPERIVKDDKTFRELVADALVTKTPLTLTYVYTVEDDLAQLFTTESNAKIEDFTWMNTYYQWLQYYSGTNVEIEEIKRTFDHYVYNSDGHIIDEVYNEEKVTKIVSNPSQPYETKGFLNTHLNQDKVYGDENAQSEDERQKWALIGDPYGFTMKNYAQYQQNVKATVTLDERGALQTTNAPSTARSFALAVDEDGNTYLANINSGSTNKGTIDKLISFAYSSSSNKDLQQAKGSGVNAKDPTGNTLNLGSSDLSVNPVGVAKPFFLSNLKRYADIVQYHLVIAHQHSTDHTDVLEAEAVNTVKKHLYEFLKYRGIYEHDDSTYYLTYTDHLPTSEKNGADGTTVSSLLKKYGSLRDLVSYPIADRLVSRIGIGNRPQVPWYMKRQFCTYTCYQRDVLRSVVDLDSKVYAEVDEEWMANGRRYKEIGGVLYKVDPSSPFADKDNDNVLFRTFFEDGVEKRAYNIKWVSVFDQSQWTVVNEAYYNAHKRDDSHPKDSAVIYGTTYRKIPKFYNEILEQNGHELVKLQECHFNRKVVIDVVYTVNPGEFQFAESGRNTTAWYQMTTNNDRNGLMNFSYKDGIGTRLDRSEHVTNNYLWAPEGDPYGFVLRSRYATINGTGWDDVAVTTVGHLPKSGTDPAGTDINDLKATYTGTASTNSSVPFNNKRIIHLLAGQESATNDGATNAVYEMFEGDFQNSFIMHPTSAWTDNSDADFTSYYMVHNTTSSGHTTTLAHKTATEMRSNADANWRLLTSPEQLWPYFARAGYVGGLDPAKAQSFSNDELYNTLKDYMDNKAKGIITKIPYTTLNKIREVVYKGTFKDKNGADVPDDATRSSIALPMFFVPENLVTMKPGYYRLKAFSEKALDTDGADMKNDKSGVCGIIGPRYISGYRFKSEETSENFLHLFDTDLQHSSLHTFAQLSTQITAAGNPNRNIVVPAAMTGNIEILPADFDPSSIFQFESVTDGDEFYRERYTLKTQGMTLVACPGNSKTAKTELTDNSTSFLSSHTGFKEKFRIDDIGGTAMTLRMRRYEKNEVVNGKTLTTWDDMIAENLQTSYLCIDPDHRYRVTINYDNEMTEIGDHNDNGLNGIQSTCWLLQPVGVKEEWPFNQMPLRVEVHQGGVKNQDLTGDALTAEANKDKYYYGTLYVPFDTRIGRTTDAAFTMITNPSVGDDGTGKVTMSSVSQHNDMGNPQYVPANMPVVLRTDNPGSFVQKNQDGSTYATRHFINMYLPYDRPMGITANINADLHGEYLEQTLTTEGLVPSPATSTKKVMVFGLPFQAHDGENSHKYNYNKQVGFYTNENWARQYAPTADLRSATDAQRDNLYVYHNKIYYIYAGTSGARQLHIVALFDGEDDIEFQEDRPIDETVTGENVPWPCDVYDLQGRRVAENETPKTLRKNHPSLLKGVYIFGGHKVIVR